MPRYFAFLRAINVGGRVVRMEALRDLFTAQGFSAVETFIASGNVIFQTRPAGAAALEKRIAAHLESSLGYAVPTFLRNDAELAAIAAYQPFPLADIQSAGACCVGFLAQPLTPPQIELLMSLQTAIDTFHVHNREIYWLCRSKQNESKITNTGLERKLKAPFTFRNLTTIAKLAARYK